MRRGLAWLLLRLGDVSFVLYMLFDVAAFYVNPDTDDPEEGPP